MYNYLMDIFQIIILSAIEGITEFLPISSTAHLILASKLLSFPQTNFAKSFEIAIQFGAILSVMLIYLKYLSNNKKVFVNLFFSFIPTGIIGFLLYPAIKNVFFESELLIITSLFLGGFFILYFEDRYKAANNISLGKLSINKSIIIGIIQSLSVVPGVSRALAAIIGGVLVGMKKKDAVIYSFLLAVPTIASASFFDLFNNIYNFSASEISSLLMGMFLSFVFAAITINAFTKFVKNNNFKIFGVYRILIAILSAFILLK